ncbi:hypothetical protein HDU93_009046 [Gonapodya sp. JEL0774]|nr:hypothetical protein HDU93_009046 [Gonapodya sp. JEL0774]
MASSEDNNKELSQVSLSSVAELPIPPADSPGSNDALAPKRSAAERNPPAPVKTTELPDDSLDDEDDEDAEDPVVARRKQNYIIGGLFLALVVIVAIIVTAVMVLRSNAPTKVPPPIAFGNTASSSSPGGLENTETRITGGGDSS